MEPQILLHNQPLPHHSWVDGDGRILTIVIPQKGSEVIRLRFQFLGGGIFWGLLSLVLFLGGIGEVFPEGV